ncbi:hypothetical protein niasHT_000989 [Heterodera trifolii]|uniref:Uncharacterized protein n=1 Tax=Heterodera trifolii TaxID=157864 RepID=A0ABD2LSW2_9BILA
MQLRLQFEEIRRSIGNSQRVTNASDPDNAKTFWASWDGTRDGAIRRHHYMQLGEKRGAKRETAIGTGLSIGPFKEMRQEGLRLRREEQRARRYCPWDAAELEQRLGHDRPRLLLSSIIDQMWFWKEQRLMEVVREDGKIKCACCRAVLD